MNPSRSRSWPTYAILPILLLACTQVAHATRRERIIPYSPALARIVAEVDALDLVVGITRWTELPPGIERPILGDHNSIHTEQLLRVNPDCILVQHSDLSAFDLVQRVRPSLHLEYVPLETLEDVRKAAMRIGELTGRETAARSAIETFDQHLDQARNRLDPPPRVLFIIGTDRPLVAGKGTFIDELITLTGGLNVGRQVPGITRWRNAELETILEARPDVLICQVFPAGGEADALAYWQRWPSLPAVANRQLHVVSGPDWSVPSLRLGPLAVRLARLIEQAHDAQHENTAAPMTTHAPPDAPKAKK